MALRGIVKNGFWQFAGLALLAAVTLALCVHVLTRDVSANVSAGTSQTATDPALPSAEPSETSPAASPAPAADPPQVPTVRSADFAEDDQLPQGARILDNESVGEAMAVTDGVLTHGSPRAAGAVSSLEARLTAPVQKLTARVRFGAGTSGSAVLVGWAESLVNAREAGQPVPQSGLRLVAGPDSWDLTIYDKRPETIASGTFEAVTGAATFEVYRDGADVWVVDPEGTVTTASDPRVESLTGPWACWQLLETKADQVPAAFEAVAAG